jgi:hypothetical protein
MENASKALIMAAGVLLGVMLISFAVYLFSVFGDYSGEVQTQMEARRVEAFNTQFTKYYGSEQRENPYDSNSERSYDGPILCTAQDVVTIANLAKDSNTSYGVYDDDPDYTSDNLNDMYITVNLLNLGNKGTHIENWDKNKFTNFIKENTFVKDKTTNKDDTSKAKYYYVKNVTYMNMTDSLQRVRVIEIAELDVEAYLK